MTHYYKAPKSAERQRTSCIYTVWRSEHAIFPWELSKLTLGAELLPLVLASFELLVCLDFAWHLCGTGRSVTDFAWFFLRLACQIRVDICSSGDDVGIDGYGRRTWRAWGTISLALLGIVCSWLDVLGRKGFRGGVVLESDDIHWLAG